MTLKQNGIVLEPFSEKKRNWSDEGYHHHLSWYKSQSDFSSRNLTEAKLGMAQQTWARRCFSNPCKTRPRWMEEPWVLCGAPVTKAWEGCVCIGLDFGADAPREWKGCCEDLLGMSFWKFWEELPSAKISMGSPFQSSLGVGDACHAFCFI